MDISMGWRDTDARRLLSDKLRIALQYYEAKGYGIPNVAVMNLCTLEAHNGAGATLESIEWEYLGQARTARVLYAKTILPNEFWIGNDRTPPNDPRATTDSQVIRRGARVSRANGIR